MRIAVAAPLEVDLAPKLDKMSDMKKINAREFQKRFGQISAELGEGQAVEVTKRGKLLGRFTKIPPRRVKTPDFVAALRQHTYSRKLGNQLLKQFYESLS